MKRLAFILFLLNVLQSPGMAQMFTDFLHNLRTTTEPDKKARLIDEYFRGRNVPIVEGEHIYFVYRGAGTLVSVPSELNRWDPSTSSMMQVPGTDFFYRRDSLPINGRVEYKIWVDSSWILDPLNPRNVHGGLGDNSDLWMPEYVPSLIDSATIRKRGTIDTVWLTSTILHRRHPLFVYSPAGVRLADPLPVLFVMDGGDYLSFGHLRTTLDLLIERSQIRSLLAVCIDPRTDLKDQSTNKRMTDYAASDRFVDFLLDEVTPFIERRYPCLESASNRTILGASMGGLIGTYAVLTRPDFIRNCAAQSPAYYQADSAIIKLVMQIPATMGTLYIQTGTINDTRIESRLVSKILERKGINLRYEEFPEGHNWRNWSTHLESILTYFFPANRLEKNH